MINNLKFLRNNLYQLKKQYGSKITLIKVTDSSYNYENGSKNISKTQYLIKAIILPTTTQRFPMPGEGGIYETGIINPIIIDFKDIPRNLTINETDYILYNSRRFSIIKISDYGENIALVLNTKEIKGEEPEQVHEQQLAEMDYSIIQQIL